jgi:hypothetical protein
MEIKKLIEFLNNTTIFKEWYKNNEKCYLVHVFFMENQDIHIGYYNEETDKITSFTINANIDEFNKSNEELNEFLAKKEIKIMNAEETFKESGKIMKLNLSNIKTDINEIIKYCDNFFKKNYEQEIVTKRIIILQNIEDCIIYNLTFITKAFNFINLKVDAKTLEIISNKKESILSLKKEEF